MQEQGKQIILCKVPALTGMTENQEVDKAVKEATMVPGYYIQCLSYTDYNLRFQTARNAKWQER